MASPALASPDSRLLADKIRVMVVDDSAVVRGLVSRWINAETDIEIISSHRNGRVAVEAVEADDPDVVILDIEMPEMDGLTALPLLLKKKPGLPIVMASTLTRRNAEISLKALTLGARDYLPKPEAQHGLVTADDFRRDLLAKVRALAPRRRRAPQPGDHGLRTGTQTPGTSRPGEARFRNPAAARPAAADTISLRPPSKVRPRILLIGSSTGGPPALSQTLKTLSRDGLKVPILITQHMPPTFTDILAEHLARAAGRPAAEAVDGEPLRAGGIYVAPGGKHMLVEAGATPKIRLDDGPPINFCKPAVDPLFSSAAQAYGPATLAAVLTGMGHDGAEGGKAIVEAGGTVIAQDEATSVVWGMPGAAARAGLCAAVLPLDAVPGKLAGLLKGGRA